MEPISYLASLSLEIDTVKDVTAMDVCPQGHELTPDLVYKDPIGTKRCRVCARESSRAYYQRKKQALAELRAKESAA